MKKISFLLLLITVLICPQIVKGDMSSATYEIYADVVADGGVLSTGGTFSLEDTVGESAIGSITAGTYVVQGGYQAMTMGAIAMSVSDATLSLGELSASSVKTDNTIVTVTTDNASGYTLSTGVVSGTSISSVADGTVTAGSEEYGVAAAGADALLVGDVAITSALSVASSATPAAGNQTTLTFKASISGSSVAGSYTQTIPLIAAVNL